MASDWRQSTWGEEISLEYGKGIRGYKDAKGPYRVYGSNGPVGWTTKSLADGPGVILGRKGAYRGVEYSKKPFFVIDTAYYVKPKNNHDMRWLYYAIQHYKLGEINDGSPIPSTTRAAVYVRDLNIPPLPEQRAIAHILGSLDDKIELNRRMNETLEAMAQALFKSWFIDFDPVIDNALAAGNVIPEELQPRAALRESLGDARKPLPEEIHDLFPSEFDFTKEMGWIPRGWNITQIGEMLELAYGKALAAKVREPGPYPVYGSGGIGGYHKEAIVEGPGIIVGRKGTVGSVYWESDDFFPIDTVFFVKLKKNVPLYWVYQNLLQMDIASLGADSAVPGVNRNSIYSKKWILPSEQILSIYWMQLSPLTQKKWDLADQNRSLESLRDTLLPKLLSGEIRIPEAEKLVEAVNS